MHAWVTLVWVNMERKLLCSFFMLWWRITSCSCGRLRIDGIRASQEMGWKSIQLLENQSSWHWIGERTRWMCVGQDHFNQTEKYIYLGTVVCEGNEQQADITARMRKFNKYVRMLYPLLKYKHVSKHCKKLHCGIRALTTRTESKIQWKWKCGDIRQMGKRGKWRNSRISSGLNSKPMLESILRSKVQWYEHAGNIPEDRCVKKYLKWRW